MALATGTSQFEATYSLSNADAFDISRAVKPVDTELLKPLESPAAGNRRRRSLVCTNVSTILFLHSSCKHAVQESYVNGKYTSWPVFVRCKFRQPCHC